MKENAHHQQKGEQKQCSSSSSSSNNSKSANKCQSNKQKGNRTSIDGRQKNDDDSSADDDDDSSADDDDDSSADDDDTPQASTSTSPSLSTSTLEKDEKKKKKPFIERCAQKFTVISPIASTVAAGFTIVRVLLADEGHS
jgi:hypothetical protein